MQYCDLLHTNEWQRGDRSVTPVSKVTLPFKIFVGEVVCLIHCHMSDLILAQTCAVLTKHFGSGAIFKQTLWSSLNSPSVRIWLRGWYSAWQKFFKTYKILVIVLCYTCTKKHYIELQSYSLCSLWSVRKSTGAQSLCVWGGHSSSHWQLGQELKQTVSLKKKVIYIMVSLMNSFLKWNK